MDKIEEKAYLNYLKKRANENDVIMTKKQFIEFYSSKMVELEGKLNHAFRDCDIIKMNNYNGKIDMLNEVLDLFDKEDK